MSVTLYATNIWDAPGTLREFEFNWVGGYLSAAHIRVEIEDKATRARTAVPYSLLNDYTVRLEAEVPAGNNLWIYRSTPVGLPLVDFTDGARFTEMNLDTATQQSIFATAELYDKVALGLIGQEFSGTQKEVTSVATADQTVFTAPYHLPTDLVQVFVNRLRLHPQDVDATASNTVTIPPQRAGVSVTVEVIRLSPLVDSSGGGSTPTPNPVTGTSLGTGAAVFKDKTGDTLRFKSIKAGTNVTITETATEVQIASTAAGGGTAVPTESVNLGTLTMNASTPNGRFDFPDTGGAAWVTGPCSQTVEFTFIPNNYFTANPNGHIAIVGRCDTALINTAVSGQGFIIGKAETGNIHSSMGLFPSSCIETWRVSAPGDTRWLYPNTAGGPGRLMSDSSRYKFKLITTKHYDGTRTIRYIRLKWNSAVRAWDEDVDTGDVTDNNTTTNLDKRGLVIGHVFADSLVPWSVIFEDVTVTWGPPSTPATDSRSLLPRAGGEITGDVTFGSSRLYVRSTNTPITWTRFVDRTAGADTQLLAVPNSASGASALLLGNSSSANFGYLTASVSPTYASIHTGVNGSGTRPSELRFSWDGGTNSLKATAGGIYAPGASSPLGINTGIMQNIVNLGGPNATGFANSAPLDVDNVCKPGTISSILLGGGFTASQAGHVETAIRPLYCLLSVIAASARNKGCA